MKISKDHIRFLIFLAIVIILTQYLIEIITNAWNTDLMETIADKIKLIEPSGISLIIGFIFGSYIGSLILLFIDRKKRIQAGIVSIGIYLIFRYISINFDVKWNILSIIVGIILGTYLGSRGKNSEKYEFRLAARNISLFSTLYAAISFTILYISYGGDNNSVIRFFLRDTFVLLTFAYFFGKLMSYEAGGPKIFILGPANSGKTLFLVGCYMRVLNIAEYPIKPSKDLVALIKEMHSGDTIWPARTQYIQRHEFTYETGKLFPKSTTLKIVDYPGPYIEKVLDFMYSKRDVKDMNPEEKKYALTAQEIVKADELIFIVDGAKYPNFEEMGIDNYINIIIELHKNGRSIKPYIVVTKSDIFKDEYPNSDTDYKGFKKFIEDKFSENIFFRQLITEASGASFYPVFYYTKKMSDSYIPLRDDTKNVFTYGFDKFMDDLTER